MMRPQATAFLLFCTAGFASAFRAALLPTRSRAGLSSFDCRGVLPSSRGAGPVLAAADDEQQDSEGTSTGTRKRRRRKAPLPAELLQGQSQPDEQELTVSATRDAEPESLDVVDGARTGDPASLELQLQERLKKDIARFRESEERQQEGEDEDQWGLGALAETAGGVFQKVLIADFFVVLGFLAWFVAGVVQKSTSDGTEVLDLFNQIWTPVIQPALGILMAGTIGVGIANNVASRSKEGR